MQNFQHKELHIARHWDIDHALTKPVSFTLQLWSSLFAGLVNSHLLQIKIILNDEFFRINLGTWIEIINLIVIVSHMTVSETKSRLSWI